MDKGLRYNGNKVRLSLVPPEFLLAVAEVLEFGATKYDANNWRKFDSDQVKGCIDSVMRHLEAYRMGQWLDEESNLPHLAHAATNLAFMITLKDKL